MTAHGHARYRGAEARLTSIHHKERVIAPVLRDELGILLGLTMGVDTDRFGTFSREIERSGSQLDAARAKIAAGFEQAPSVSLGVASEGSFGPHPDCPFLAFGRELVLLVDRETGFELSGSDAGPGTNFSHRIARDLDDAVAFAQGVGFPEHGLIVMGCREEKPAPEIMLRKDITELSLLEEAVRSAIRLSGAAFIETDMRAHRNPTRMAAIERATQDLARRFHSRCPRCATPGFDVTERIRGLPCAWCGTPTRAFMTDIMICRSCGYRHQRPAHGKAEAEPRQCDICNP